MSTDRKVGKFLYYACLAFVGFNAVLLGYNMYKGYYWFGAINTVCVVWLSYCAAIVKDALRE